MLLIIISIYRDVTQKQRSLSTHWKLYLRFTETIYNDTNLKDILLITSLYSLMEFFSPQM